MILLYEVSNSLKIQNWLSLALQQYKLSAKQCKNQDKYKKVQDELQMHKKNNIELLYKYIKIYQGKVTINFSDQKALISLTRSILKVIFKIQWIIPIQNLCPRIPNRVNYLIWIHRFIINHKFNQQFDMDKSKNKQQQNLLINQCSFKDFNQKIVGIDVGTGASLIYPLLGNKMFNWKFIATQKDIKSVQHASKLIKLNKLQTQIQVRLSNDKYLLKNIISIGQRINFLMCNPPFFDCQLQLENPLSIMTQNQHNMKGGQYELFFQLYMQSFQFLNIQVFTMMIGLGRDFQQIRIFLEQQKRQYDILEWIRFGKINQSQNTRFIIAWKIKKLKQKIK